MFYSLHNHTEWSNIRFLDSINRAPDMVNKAIRLGMNGIAFTDHECLSGAVEFLKLRDKIKETNPDFKIIFGNEIYLIDKNNIKQNPTYYHFLLLAKDLIGWQQLKTLSSRAWERAYVEKGIMRVPTIYEDLEEVVKTNPGHLIGSSACLGSEIDKYILAGDKANFSRFVRWCISVFGQDNFFLELQVSDSEEQIKCNRTLINAAKYFNLPYIFTTDSHYLDKEDFAIHSAFLNSKQANDRETEKFYKFTYMMSLDEMREILLSTGLTPEEIEQGLNNTGLIGDRVEEFDFRHSTIVPSTKIPDFSLSYAYDNETLYPAIHNFYHSGDIRDRYLMYLVEQGILKKQIKMDETRLKRINTELDVIEKVSAGLNQKVSSYFLLMREVIDIAWNYSFVGVSRGSSAGFYINYLIELVQIDPLQYDLPYWRFINDVRFELPDVDTDLAPSVKPEIMKALKEYYGEDNVLNCITFKTNSLKAAILTACRGLGYSSDEAKTMSGMVPTDRGHVYTLQECREGNEELDLDPAPEIITKLSKYPRLVETVEKIEGLRLNASIHASAVYIFDHGYLEHNSLMRAPNGTRVTAFNMDDTNALSGLKIDLLYTDAQDKLMKCMNLLLKDNVIQWQGSLRATYNKYLHPDVLDYSNPQMWADAASGKISNLFQWETQVGETAIKKAKPTSVLEMATINSAIRVQSEGDIQPIDRYIAFHKDISLWYKEMYDAGLNDFEVEIMKDHLEKTYGNSLQQEDFMQLVMDPNIAGYTLAESNKLRKVIAHKILDELIEQKDIFMEHSKKVNCRPEFANYVWDYCIQPLAKYSFSIIHAVGYSIVAVQEMNIATRFNPLYWACACLCVNAGNSNTDFDSDSDEESEEELNSSIKYTAPNYGKIAKAIDDAQHRGINIELPDINTSQLDFIPNTKTNSILYSLLAVSVVNSDLFDKIVDNRPYNSLYDFIDKVQPTNVQMISLIKAGCFDKLEQLNRRAIMGKFLKKLAEEMYPVKDKLTTVQLKKALDLGFDLSLYQKEIRIYKFKKYLDANKLDKENKRYILDEEACIKFFKEQIEPSLNLSKGQYGYLPNSNIYVKQASLKTVCDNAMQSLMNYLNSEEGRRAFASLEQNTYIKEMQDKYCKGSVASWEMATLSFYHEPHELIGINNNSYQIKNFSTLPEKPVTEKYLTQTGEEKEIPKLSVLAGTVTDTVNNKYIVSISTVYGIVNVKLVAKTYADFNQDISTINKETGKKTVIDPSWFKRGNKIVVHGYRRENMFVARADYSHNFPKLVGLIESIHQDGSLDIRYRRKQVS